MLKFDKKNIENIKSNKDVYGDNNQPVAIKDNMNISSTIVSYMSALTCSEGGITTPAEKRRKIIRSPAPNKKNHQDVDELDDTKKYLRETNLETKILRQKMKEMEKDMK